MRGMNTTNKNTDPVRLSKVQNSLASKGRRLAQSSLDESLGFAMRRADQTAAQEVSPVLARFNIRPPQYAVLVLIGANPGFKQSEIIQAYGIQKTNFVALITGLEELHLVERRRVEDDRRSFALHLTQKGIKLVREMQIAHSRVEKQIRTRLGDRRSSQLLKLLHDFNGS